MKILSLNVNNFGGARKFKPYDRGAVERLRFQNDPKRVETAVAIAMKIKGSDFDIIVLSEFDIAAPAGKEFIKLFDGYVLVVPQAHNKAGRLLTEAKDYWAELSITVVLIKQEWYGKEFRKGLAPDDWADFNLVMLGDMTILGIHAKEGNLEALKSWAMKATHSTQQILIIGDFNTYEENDKCPYTRDKYREILKMGYIDLCPPKIPTYIGKTCIDHALISRSIMDKYRPVEATVDHSFIEDSLSDHAAVTIDIADGH